MASPFVTAFADDVVAIVRASAASYPRLSVSIYATSQNMLQATLTCHDASSQSDNGVVVVEKLFFGGKNHQYLCAKLSNSVILVWSVRRGVLLHKLTNNHDEADVQDVSVSDDLLFVLKRNHQNHKLCVYEHSLEKAKLLRKIKVGSSSDDDDDDCSLATTSQRLLVQQKNLWKLFDTNDGQKLSKWKLDGDDVLAKCYHVQLIPGTETRSVTTTSNGVYVHATNAKNKTRLLMHIAESDPLRVQSTEKGILVQTLPGSALFYAFLGQTCRIETSGAAAAAYHMVEKKDTWWLQTVHVNDQNRVQIHQHVMQKDNDWLETITVKATEIETPALPKRKAQDVIKTTTLGPGQAGSESMRVEDSVKRARRTMPEEETTVAERLRKIQSLQEEEEQEEEEEQTVDPTTESLSKLLCQALRSSDDAMLEFALQRKSNTIEASLQDLSEDDDLLLLTKLTKRLVHKPSRAPDLMGWLCALLPKITKSRKTQQQQQLIALKNLLQERTEHFAQLLQLEGRLTMLGQM